MPLPAFTSTVRAMNAVWIEAWMRLDTRVTEGEILLADLIYVDNVAFRLVLRSRTTDPRPFLRLYFFPGSSKQQVSSGRIRVALSCCADSS